MRDFNCEGLISVSNGLETNSKRLLELFMPEFDR